MKRILLAGIHHETHSFVDEVTPLERFTTLRTSEALLSRRGDGSMLDGFLEVADAEGWHVLPAAYYSATPSGTVADTVLTAFLDDLLPVARKAAADGVDAIYLLLHGAMSTPSYTDAEGEVIARLRAVPGLEDVPLFGAFDLHANLSERMVALSNGLVCYRENPHTDSRDTAVRAARLLARCLDTGEVPRSVRRHARIIWSPPGTGTADTPMRDLEACAR